MLKKIFQRVFFADADKAIQRARDKTLSLCDLPQLPPSFTIENLPNDYLLIRTSSVRHFLWDFICAPGTVIWKMIILALVVLSCVLMTPVAIEHLILLVDNRAHWFDIGAVGLFLVIVTSGQSLVMQHYFYQSLKSVQTGVIGLHSLIYEKTLRIHTKVRSRRQVGDVINLIGSDADVLSRYPWTVIELGQSFLLLILSLGVLYTYLGMGAIAALGTLIILSPLTKYISQHFVLLDKCLMDQRDKRVSLLSTIFTGIRVVKYFTWENKSKADISELRHQEMTTRRQLIKAETAAIFMYLATSVLLAIVGFVTYWHQGGELTAAVVFPCLSIFLAMEHPFGQLAELVATISAGNVAAQRTISYLNEIEYDGNIRQSADDNKNENMAVKICLSHVSVHYDQDQILEDIELEINAGELVAIVGPIGAGKSTLLTAILGETELSGGKISFNGQQDDFPIAWVPQTSFICNATFRENIELGPSHTELPDIIAACALETDIIQLRDGIDTLIGENGINLSGGQKQRLNLARAAALSTPLVLLDDPVSAVDEDTADHLISELLLRHWSKRTVVMTTHRLKYLSLCHKVIYIVKGRLEAQGSLAELLTTHSGFRSFYQSSLRESEHSNEVGSRSAKTTSDGLVDNDDHESKKEKGGGAIDVAEDREVGQVGSMVFFDYIKAMSASQSLLGQWGRSFFLIFSTLAVIILPFLQTGWLAVWMDHDGLSPNPLFSFLRPFLSSDLHNLVIFSLFGVAFLACFLVQHWFWALRSLYAADLLFRSALDAVLATRIRFFDINPVGRILNRFSSDHDLVERQLPWAFEATIRSGINVIIAMITLLGVLPMLFLVFVPICGLFYVIQMNFRRAGRDIKRLTSITRSPKFAHFKQTIEGVQIIRALGKEQIFRNIFQQAVTDWQRAFHSQILVNRWFSARLAILGALVTSGIVTTIVFLSSQGWFAVGTCGFVLIIGLGLWNHMNWCIRSFSEAESSLIGVERLRTYGLLNAEEKMSDTIVEPPHNWPQSSHLIFENVSGRYDVSLPCTVKNISFDVPSGSKVGIVGRSGAGKSSLIGILYRFVEIVEGQVRFDGYDITTIPLKRLRRALAIIPQDPMLFMGKLRENIDRYGDYEDDYLWAVIHKVGLSQAVQRAGGLDAPIDENGLNFSQGQRQLLCLARALLIDAKIIILDEATANVDPVTDESIHKVLSHELAGRTVLVIAHRLATLKNCDMIVELTAGRVKYISQNALEPKIVDSIVSGVVDMASPSVCRSISTQQDD